jgi:hypothetical protein
MNPEDFCTSSQIINLSSHVAINPLIVTQNPLPMCRYEGKQYLPAKECGGDIFDGNETFGPPLRFPPKNSINLISWPL